MQELSLHDFPLITFDKVRYADTDRQGHVNNAVFSTFLETGRVEFLYNQEHKLLAEGASFVIAALNLSFLHEIGWPGKVDIGTGIVHIGTSSIKIHQQIYQNGRCAASAETIIVQTKDNRSLPLSDAAKATLQQWLLQR
ncbi:MAG: acyl-CoA thioesterase [Saprospiraceae bacterium]